MAGETSASNMAPQTKLKLFISYVHEDGEICDAVNNALTSAFGDNIRIFIDKVSIQQGHNIRGIIERNLVDTDELVVISTGIERPSHDWAGFELGYYTATHSEPKVDHPLWGNVVTLCAGGLAPRPETHRNYIPIDVDRAALDRTEQNTRAP